MITGCRSINWNKFSKWGYFALAVIVVLITILPIYYAISLSIRSPAETFTVKGIPVPFLHFKPTLANWREELSIIESQRALLNSTIIAISTATRQGADMRSHCHF